MTSEPPDGPDKPDSKATRGGGAGFGQLAGLPWSVGKALGRTVYRAGTLWLPKPRKSAPGTAPGIEHDQLAAMPRPVERARVQCFDFNADHVARHDVDDLHAFLEAGRPDWAQVRWVNVDGLADTEALHNLAREFQLHPLALEDVLHVPQRPKVETYSRESTAAPLFVVARMLTRHEHQLRSEQISVFLGSHTLITLQERPGDVFDPIRQRLQRPESRLRREGADFLLYALLDAAVDSCFPLLEHYSEHLAALDQRIIEQEDRHVLHEIHAAKHELMLMRREMWPMRELISALLRHDDPLISENTRFYLRDVQDHAAQAIDLIETYHEITSAMTDTWMSAMSNRMNEVMKVLTIIATIFIPLSFLAGVYGMNMPIPETQWWWWYPVFWGICLTVGGGMLWWFRRRRWL